MDEFDYNEAAQVEGSIADDLALDTDAWIAKMLG